MLVHVPKSDRHSQVLLTINHPLGSDSFSVDDTHSTVNVTLPEGVNEDDVEIVSQFIGRNGQPDPDSAPTIQKDKHVEAAIEPLKTDGDATPVASLDHVDLPDHADVRVEVGQAEQQQAEPAAEAAAEPQAEVTAELVVGQTYPDPAVAPKPPGQGNLVKRHKH